MAASSEPRAYHPCKCHDASADRGTNAVIPPRKNAKRWKTVTACAILFSIRRFITEIWALSAY
ncbi:hypothetical protein GGQ68_003643 [Sagittula marina]|uniref:Uncharacterized protein n=1 Tax=Sagittula marina TaxID=943940 RepID=A0A7W6DUS9_9RHOB|nr:hypothetical protein [Sagittula marina]